MPRILTLLHGLMALLCLLLAPSVSAVAEEARFDILEYVVEGNTVLPALVIERAVYPHLGPGRSAADVDAARSALESAYHDAGYLTVAVEIPAQQVAAGEVVLKVVEASVDRLKVSGAQYTLPSQVREQTPSMATGTVPNFNDIQDDLGRLGRNADLRINPLLRPGRAPGSIEIELAMEDRSPFHGSIELNNKRSLDTRTGRLEAAARYDNLWQRRHSIGVNYFVSPQQQDDVSVWGLTYSLPLGEGTLAAFFARSDSDVQTTLGTQSIGKGDTAGLRWIRPLPLGLRSGFFHSLSAGVDWKNNRQDTVLADGEYRLAQPVRYTTLVAQYSAGGAGETHEWRAGAGVTLGLNPLTRREMNCSGVRLEQFECRRSDADANFAAFRFDLGLRWAPAPGWTLDARSDLQIAGGRLINTEQFSAGGMDSVRGYLEGERAADNGLRVAVDMLAPAWYPLAALPVRGLVFYDWAKLRNHGPLVAGEIDEVVLASAGVGLRLGESTGLSGELLFARVFHAGGQGTDNTDDGDRRVVVRMKYAF
ncbi:MAG: ShlB/FhaC/HecB family hemolysin secretion/activation protein [Parazoarcus communis]